MTRQLIAMFEVSQGQFLVIDNYYSDQSPKKEEMKVDGSRTGSGPAGATDQGNNNSDCCKSS